MNFIQNKLWNNIDFTSQKGKRKDSRRFKRARTDVLARHLDNIFSMLFG